MSDNTTLTPNDQIDVLSFNLSILTGLIEAMHQIEHCYKDEASAALLWAAEKYAKKSTQIAQEISTTKE